MVARCDPPARHRRPPRARSARVGARRPPPVLLQRLLGCLLAVPGRHSAPNPQPRCVLLPGEELTRLSWHFSSSSNATPQSAASASAGTGTLHGAAPAGGETRMETPPRDCAEGTQGTGLLPVQNPSRCQVPRWQRSPCCREPEGGNQDRSDFSAFTFLCTFMLMAMRRIKQLLPSGTKASAERRSP